MMPVENYEMERRAKFLAGRENLLIELDGGLSADGIRLRRRAHLRRSMAWTLAERTGVFLRRGADVFFSMFMITLLMPVFLLAWLAASLVGGGLRRQVRLGRWATHFNLYQLHFPEDSILCGFTILEQMPTLFNIFKGDMSFIGPRPIAPSEEFAEKRLAWKRYNLRPGLLSLWWIRKRANIAYGTEVSYDSEYVETKSFWGDVGIAVRALPAAFYGSGVSNAPPQIRFLGIRIDNLTMAEASARIVTYAQGDEPTQVCFVNADCVNLACGDDVYRDTLTKARLVLADGIGVRLAGAILDQNVRENVNGTDMLPYLCDALQKAKLKLFLLGGKPGVGEDAAKWVAESYPDLAVAGIRHGYFTPDEEPDVEAEIRSSGADVVLVALGAPRQDKWIAEHKAAVGAKVLIGVGGLLDFYSGRIPRAPLWVRELGMEWFYRFVQEPKRMWRRYFVGNVDFLYRVVCERMRVRAAQRLEGNAR